MNDPHTRRHWLGTLLAWPLVASLPARAAGTALPADTPSASASASATPPAPPPLMLAQSYHPGIDLRGYWISEKYDGVRGYWDGRQLWLRSGIAVQPPAWFTAGWPAEPLDGELWAGRGAFDQVAGTLRQQPAQTERWRQLRFMVFDLPATKEIFDARRVTLGGLLRQGGTHIAAVPHRRVDDHKALQALLRDTVAAGGEGLMLNRGDAPYRALRSDDLLKLKPLDDAEAVVLSQVPGRGKHAGRMGALWVQTADGVRFKLGSGFSDAQRDDPPDAGARVVYQFNGLTAKGVPRFARFLRVREAMEG